jgi:hypothetical protein
METTIEEILTLVKKKMIEQGGYDRDAYKQFVDESIEFYQERGYLTDDDNLEFIEDRLMDAWPEVEEYLAQK